MIYKIVLFEFLFIVELEWPTPNMKNWCLNPQTSSWKKSVHAKIQSEHFLCQIHPLLISSSMHMMWIETQNCLCEKLAFSFFFNIDLCRCLLLRGIKVWCLHVFATFGFHVQGTWVLLSVACWHREKRLEYFEKYYEEHKDDRKDYRKAYSQIEIECDVCKCTVRKCNLAKHILTKKHKK